MINLKLNKTLKKFLKKYKMLVQEKYFLLTKFNLKINH